ncbi:MAG: CHC2 zinc finger domain-containing protein [Giesbergeria sp.]|nr:CHC2 zinc finger domain-containing protein [Giesbergeria sp.]
MPFDRRNLPDAVSYYESEGLKLTSRGKWRTTECKFHGGSDSMRINTDSGAFACMAGCGARGGDVLAYHMAQHGLEFVEAAKALGAWVDDGKPVTQHKPAPLTPRQALEVLAVEANLVAIAAGNLAHGVELLKGDFDRLKQAANRINRLAEVFA